MSFIKFHPGEKVRLKHTGELAVVKYAYGDGMVEVILSDSLDVIPVFEEDVVSEYDYRPVTPEPKEDKQIRPAGKSTKHDPSQAGVFLCFKRLNAGSDMFNTFDIILVNNTPTTFVVNIAYLEGSRSRYEKSYLLKEAGYELVEKFDYLSLNDSPEFKIECSRTATDGSQVAIKENIKLKVKTFLKPDIAPLLDFEAFVIKITDGNTAKNDKESLDLKAYAKSNVPKKSSPKPLAGQVKTDVEEFAHFSNELDLHIDTLKPDHRGMDKGQILTLQLSVFDRYISRAITLGIDKVYVIHGLGKGKLKSEIEHRLKINPYVVSYNNDWDVRYGFGATTIYLR